MRFEARYTVVGRMPLFPPEVIRQEPSFERRRGAWVLEHGGPIARAFMAALPGSDAHTLVTCHLSHYREGWRYRAKGQWHTHGAPGPDKYHPSLRAPILAVLGSAALTRVCEGSFELPEERGDWDAGVRDGLSRGELRERTVEEGALVQYGWGDFHRSPAAAHDGWRVLLSAWNGEGEEEQTAPMHWVDNFYSPAWPIDPDEARRFDPYRVTWPPHDPAPRGPVRSGYRLLGRVQPGDLAGEKPLFAADPQFARRHGGPMTCAALDALPSGGWRDNPNLVVDSFLNWLTPGRVPGFDLFHFEPFPGQYEGARALANWDQTLEHVSCVFSDDAPSEFLVGDVEFAEAEEMWRACTNLQRRHALLLKSGLRAEKVPGFTLVHHTWGAFHRATPAARSGFHFRVRISRGSPRPICNAMRNLDCTDLTRF